MGSCTIKHRDEDMKSKVLRPTAVIIRTKKENPNYLDPKIRYKIFSKKDSHAPILHLELNKLRNMRISLISSNMPTEA